ncbi:MAG TPA: maleylpyruvate isomerase N-terminal domain-containing protein [Actinomycetota bacterium]
MERIELVGIAHAERDRLGRTIQYVPPGSWDAGSPCDRWRNRDVMAHLAAQDTAAAQLMGAGVAEEFEAFREANGGQFWVDGFNQWAVEVRRDVPTREVLTAWGRAADVFLEHAADLTDEDWSVRRLPWVAGDIGVRYVIQSRVIEWWVHGEDIRAGAGLEPNLQHWPIFVTNDMGIRMLPYALGLAGLSLPGVSVRVDLEGMGGGSWHWGLAARESPAEDKKPDAFIEGRAYAFCLVASRRAAAEDFLEDGNLVIGGDEELAELVLEHTRAYVE